MSEPTIRRSRVSGWKQTLPEDVADRLRTLRVEDSHEMSLLARDLYALGWSLKSLGEALDLSGEAIRMRIKRVADEPETGNTDLPAPPPLKKHVKVERPSLTELEKMQLAALQELGRKARGHHGPESPEREATEAVSRLLNDYIERGIPVADLAAVIGVQPKSVHFRLRRHGYRKLPPSQQGYQGAIRPTE